MVTYLSRSYNVWEIRTMTSTPASLANFLIAASLSFPNGSESYSIESFAMFHSYNTNQKCGPLAPQLQDGRVRERRTGRTGAEWNTSYYLRTVVRDTERSKIH